MAKVIAVSGSVGTGKTTVAKKIAKLLKFQYIDAKKIIDSNKDAVCGYDRKRKTKEIDVDRLNKVLIKIIGKSDEDNGIIIDSHLSHYLPKKYVDICLITECPDLKKLRKRLEKRKYSKLKIDENIEAEILEVCLIEALEERHYVVVVDSSKKINYKNMIKEIKRRI